MIVCDLLKITALQGAGLCECVSRFSKQVVTDQLLIHEMQGGARGLSEAGTNEDFHSFL